MLLKALFEQKESWTTATAVHIQEPYEELNALDAPSYKMLNAVHA